jgi:hypothetical protein
MGKKYHKLKIVANEPKDIWLSDDEGNLVVHEDGVIDEGLLPGKYFVEFGLGNKQHPIKLDRDLKFKQSDFEE